MGGKGSGGLRPGAGRKSKGTAAKWLSGSGARKVAVPAVDHVDVPDDLTVAERLVWLRLAPHAMKAGTLTAATEFQFGLLCRNVVLERELAKDADQRGNASHRGIIQRVDAELARFCLAPMGKPIVEVPAPVDPFDEFDEPKNEARVQ